MRTDLPVVPEHENRAPDAKDVSHSVLERPRIVENLRIEIHDGETSDVRWRGCRWLRSREVSNGLGGRGDGWNEGR